MRCKRQGQDVQLQLLLLHHLRASAYANFWWGWLMVLSAAAAVVVASSHGNARQQLKEEEGRPKRERDETVQARVSACRHQAKREMGRSEFI